VDLLSFLGVMLRRWYVTVPFGLVTCLLAVGVWTSTSPVYQSNATTLVRYPAGITQEVSRLNPYIGYGTLFVPGKVITDVVSSPTYRAQLESQGATGSYQVSMDTQIPIISIQTEDSTPEGSTATGEAVIGALDAVLRQRQEDTGAPRESFITMEVVQPPVEPTPLRSSRIRAAGGVLALGGLMTAAAALAAEAIARRRRGQAVEATETEPKLPCSVCGQWLPQPALVLHLQEQHDLAPPVRARGADRRARTGAGA
jgi:hypothetical protein